MGWTCIDNEDEWVFIEVAQLLSFLRACPNLVGITFRHRYPPHNRYNRDNTTPIVEARQEDVVRLPHLQHLTLQNLEPGQVGHYLPHIHVHSNTVLCMQTIAKNASPMEDSITVQDVRALSQFPATKQCTRLHISMTTKSKYTVTALGGPSGVRIPDFRAFDRDSGESMLAQLLTLSQVEELWLVEHKYCWDLQSGLFLFDILPEMQALRKVVVTAPALFGLTKSQAYLDQLGMVDLWPSNLYELHVLLYPHHAEYIYREVLAKSIRLLSNSIVPHRSVMVPEHCAVLRNLVEDLHLEDTIECAVYQHIPSIALPPVCSTEEEMWPAWQTNLVPPQ